MKILLDANISWRLIQLLEKHFEEVLHVDHIDLPRPATDIEIWEFARVNNCMIATNDQDLLDMLTLKNFPPKIILLRTGNQSNNFLLQTLLNHKDEVSSLYNSVEIGLLEIY